LTRRPSRVLHGPWNISGEPLGLSRGERDLGLKSDVALLDAHRFGYEADIDLGLGGREDRVARVKKAAFLARAMMRYDVFHYSFGGNTFFNLQEGRTHTEVPLLRRLGKIVLATFVGHDARPPEASPFADWDPALIEMQRRFLPKRRELMLHHADRVFYLNPDLRQWLPGAQFRPYASVDPRSVTPRPLPQRNEIVVGHAPSDRAIKGTDAVIAAVTALRDEGIPIRLDLIENVDHSEVIARIGGADLVVDQLNQGWYGVFAVEAMALGRPVLCYIKDEDPGDNPFGAELPIVRTTAQTLTDDLRGLARDRARQVELGSRGRSFVERHHDPRTVVRQCLEGLVPIPPGPGDGASPPA
jgi:hypothetical protein